MFCAADTLGGIGNIMIRTLDVRVDVLRNGVKATELYPISAPQVQMNADSAIKTSLTGEFKINDEVNWLSDEIQPVVNIDGTDYPFGVFAPTTVTENRADGQHSIGIEAYDRCWRVQSYRTDTILHLDSGTNYLTAVESLLATAGIALTLKTPTTETLTYDREDWEIGTSYLTIINQLLDEINYSQLWFNATGVAVLEPDKLLDVTQSQREYDYDSVQSMMQDNSATVMDLFNAPNVFLVVCSNTDGQSAMTAKKENNNFASPISIPRRGRKIMNLYKVNNIASQTALDDYAQILCTEGMFTGKVITISTAIMPNCGVNDIVTLNHPDADGICMESEWTVELCTGGVMTHTLQQQPRAICDETPIVHTGTIAGIAVVGVNVVGVGT